MTDLTKLTAKEFSRRIDNCDWDMEERIENERRLERLEKCEADSKLLEWLLENPWCRPMESKDGLWIVQQYTGHTLVRANTKREAVEAARAALEKTK